ncbi:MAG: thioredoxin family protein [Spirochaetaceae bacterium]|jgi:small redox-active disulfide protein 2|nr:thioredoxin family protein [Spirochaetaceae bacterium]
MKIQILGTGCPKCKMLEASARSAVEQMQITAEVIKVTELDDIMNMGVMMTPALAIDNDVKSVGKVLTVEQIVNLIKGVQ